MHWGGEGGGGVAMDTGKRRSCSVGGWSRNRRDTQSFNC